LLTDIERSTELLSRLEDGYASLASSVRRVLRRAVRKAGGHEVDARGDEFFAVFEHAPAAVEAAVELQRAMAEGPWPDGVEVRVRAGIHSGRPTLTETGYVGLAVHAAARICYGAHGGQIVLSSASRAALADAPTVGVTMRSLGSWRFQGLREPHELFQVDAHGLTASFPPLRAGTKI
jgi:class 3 adenylate cyclase